MEVTKDNFNEVLPTVAEAIDHAQFVAIDGEFTGLSAYRNLCPFDLPDDRYEKVQESARQFLLIQFGLCTFHYDRERDRWTHRAFNFYVWPRPIDKRKASDTRFLCQTSSIDFLTMQDFDFNKLFKEGISYISIAEEKTLKEAIVEKHEKDKIEGASPVCERSTRDHGFLNETSEKITAFLKSSDKIMDVGQAMSPQQKRITYSMVRRNFKEIYVERPKNEEGKSEDFFRLTKIDEKKRDEMLNVELERLDNSFGFSKVIEHLSASGKPIVGHNMLLDLCHTLNQFVRPLPKDYSEFKSLCTSTFPKLVDTKLMASTAPLRDLVRNTSLEELKNIVSESPFKLPEVVEAEDNSGYGGATTKYHEAGYDAYITGLCFLSMAKKLNSMSDGKSKNKNELNLSQPALTAFYNKMFIMKVTDVPYMNLSGDDISPSREHVFYITFPSAWKTQNLLSLFSPLGPVYISWVNDTSAFVSLNIPENAKDVLSTLNCSNVYSILPYSRYKALQKAGKCTTGITPVLESSTFFRSPKGLTVKHKLPQTRDNSVVTLKRSKSELERENQLKKKQEVKEQKRTFEVADWDV